MFNKMHAINYESEEYSVESTQLAANVALKIATATENIILQFREGKIDEVQLWNSLNDLERQGDIDEKTKRKIFWDVLPAYTRELIYEKCAYFDPRNETWAEQDFEQAEANCTSRAIGSASQERRVASRVCLYLLFLAFMVFRFCWTTVNDVILVAGNWQNPDMREHFITQTGSGLFLVSTLMIPLIVFKRQYRQAQKSYALPGRPKRFRTFLREAVIASVRDSYCKLVSEIFSSHTTVEGSMDRYKRGEIGEGLLWKALESAMSTCNFPENYKQALFWSSLSDQSRQRLTTEYGLTANHFKAQNEQGAADTDDEQSKMAHIMRVVVADDEMGFEKKMAWKDFFRIVLTLVVWILLRVYGKQYLKPDGGPIFSRGNLKFTAASVMVSLLEKISTPVPYVVPVCFVLNLKRLRHFQERQRRVREFV